eukprot:gene14137-13928_t
MSSSTPTNTSKLDRILADNQRDKEMGYRDKALKMYPHVCGRCAREFSGKRLSELTVHHRDHNHDNNPQDGSNWELLCLYCHDNEHSRYTDQQYFGEGSLSTPKIAKATHNPFAACIGLYNPKSPENVGSVMRAAGCYGVASVFYTGKRYERAADFVTDTKRVHYDIPLIGIDDLKKILPLNCVPVAVELVEGARPLPEYTHPDRALYIFGPEDGSLDKEIRDWCEDVVYIPTTGCMNLAATVNVVLYDRMAKGLNT